MTNVGQFQLKSRVVRVGLHAQTKGEIDAGAWTQIHPPTPFSPRITATTPTHGAESGRSGPYLQADMLLFDEADLGDKFCVAGEEERFPVTYSERSAAIE